LWLALNKKRKPAIEIAGLCLPLKPQKERGYIGLSIIKTCKKYRKRFAALKAGRVLRNKGGYFAGFFGNTKLVKGKLEGKIYGKLDDGLM
jgi:hypothetical protein